MWILTVLPEIVIHLILTIGLLGVIAGFVLGAIPYIKRYVLPIRIISLLILSLGLYLEGGLSNHKAYEQKTSDLKVKIAEMEKKMVENDLKIVEKVVVKKQIIKEKGKDLIQYVDREIVKYDEKFSKNNECELPNDFYKLYNESLGK